MGKSGKKTNKLPWYSEGLKFKCSGCGDCCTGEPGYVWVNREEIAALSNLVELSVDEFEEKYVRRIGVRRSLVEFPNGDCVFFDSEKRNCKVYDARPRQCRTWPFWDSNIRTEKDWKRTCEECPGSGKGKLYSLGEIEEQRKEMRI